MRGAMYTGIRREAGVGLTILLTSVLYACGHFFGSARIPAELVGPGSGIDILGGFLARFGQPLQIADAFLALAAVGALLGMVRTITGNIAACIGLHAGWVWIITFVREMSQPNEASPLRFLISQFDGVVGWLVLAWTLVIGAVLATFYRRRALAAAVQPAA